MKTTDDAHRTYLTHRQTQINEAHAWWIKCHEAGTADAPGERETASLPWALPMSAAVEYLRIGWGAKGSKKALVARVVASGEVASRGAFRVPVYGPGYAGGSGSKRIGFDRYTLDSLDKIGAEFAKVT